MIKTTLSSRPRSLCPGSRNLAHATVLVEEIDRMIGCDFAEGVPCYSSNHFKLWCNRQFNRSWRTLAALFVSENNRSKTERILQ
jgi:hypothetical protein